jgi:hypothetical protein
VDLPLDLLISGRRIKMRPNRVIKNEAAAKIEDSSLNVIIDRIIRINPTVGAPFLELGILPP